MKNIRVLTISIFDHWLTKKEASDCKYTNHSTASKSDSMAMYLRGENHFIILYKSLDSEYVCHIGYSKEKLLSTN